MTENPYSSPTTTTFADSSAPKSSERSLLTIARTVFLAWEKLRVVYVIILSVVTLMLTGTTGFSNWQVLRLIIEGAVVANVAYFAGPTIETYIRWLGYERMWPRWLMFGSGTLLSIVLAVGVLATALLPSQP